MTIDSATSADTRLPGAANDPFVIAEVGQNHDGSLGLAHAFVDAVADTGADAVKFQAHIASAESTPGEPFRVRFSPADATRYDYWKRMEFTPEQWGGLKAHAEARGLVFLCSPFSVEAVDMLAALDVAAFKVGSGEIGSRSMLRRIQETGRHVFVSAGMSDLAATDALVAFLREGGTPFTLMQCTSEYPVDFTRVGLNMLAEYRARYRCPVGLSDHSGTIYPGLAAAVLGASAIEVHVTLSREMFGPDIVASVTTAELANLVAGVRAIGTMQRSPVVKDALAAEFEPLRRIFGKSAVAVRDLAAGVPLAALDVAFRKPGTGIAEVDFDPLVGRRLVRDVPAGTILKPEDFAP